MKRILLALGLAVALSGCQAAKVANTPVDAATAQNQVLAAKTAYEALLVVAIKYVMLPHCGEAKATVLCSDPDAVAQIRKADKAAIAVLDQAEGAVRSLGSNATVLSTAVASAQNALSAYRAIVDLYTPAK